MKPRGTSVLNPSRSLIPRPGQGRGEGREGGSSRPQRTPPNLKRGQTKLSILVMRCNEWINEWKTNTSPKPGIIVLSYENDPAGSAVPLCLHWLGRAVKQPHPLAVLIQLCGGTAWDLSLSRTWTWRALRGVGVDLRAPGGVVARQGSAIAVLCFQSAGSSAGENKTSFNWTIAVRMISLQKNGQTSIIEKKTSKPPGEKQFFYVPLLFLVSLQKVFLTTKRLVADKLNADIASW